MAKTSDLQIWKVLYGLGYGGLVAGSYLFVRLVGKANGMQLFFALSAGMFAVHLVFWPTEVYKGLIDKSCWFRGTLYGLTQVMLIKGQEMGLTTTMLVASVLGGIFATSLARVFLKEKMTSLSIVALLLCTASVVIDTKILFGSLLGFLGGLTQGTGFVLSRHLMLTGHSKRTAISSGFGIAALVTAFILLTQKQFGAIASVPMRDISLGIGVAFIVQYGFFYLYAIVSTHRAIILGYSRLPWSLGIEHLLLGIPLHLKQVASCFMVLTGAILLAFETNTKTRKVA